MPQPLVFAQFVWLPVLIWCYVKKYNRKQATIKVSSVQAFTVLQRRTSFVTCHLFYDYWL
ncbi:MAG: hypothetical protein WDO71_17455 [Bacteroidota bacterium]